MGEPYRVANNDVITNSPRTDYKEKIGFKGQLLIEPKPKEPMKHQYDYGMGMGQGNVEIVSSHVFRCSDCDWLPADIWTGG